MSGAAFDGADLLSARRAALPALLRDAFDVAPDAAAVARSVPPAGIVTTGTGSSGAHARFLASVLDELGLPARYVALSAFLDLPDAAARGKTLVVFSQGLSPGARIALQRVSRWHAVWLATGTARSAAGVAAPPGADAAARRKALEDAVAAGVHLLPFPGADEYGTLMRIVGPMTGYAAALRFASALRDAAARGEPQREAWESVPAGEVCRVVADAAQKVARVAPDLDPQQLEEGLVLLASGAHTERLENLRLKWMEGALRPAPPLIDVLDLPHGPFQQIFDRRALLVALSRGDAPREDELLARAEAMLDPHRHRLLRLRSELPGPLAVFEHEALTNELVLGYAASRRIDATDWPGKGRDVPLYSFGASGDGPSPRAPDEAAPLQRRLEQMRWPEVERFLEAGGRTAILALGSIEQHGPHLPFATDAWIAAELARRLRARLPESIELPVFPVGCASEHLGFAGTLSLSDSTFAAVLADLAACVERHGFATLFVFSAHGGNARALDEAAARMRSAAPRLRLVVAPGLGAEPELFERESARHGVAADACGQHAGEFETSILLSLAPRHVRRDELAPGLAAAGRDADSIFYPDLRASSPSGTVGDPTGADASRAEAYLDAWTDSLVEVYRRGESRKYTNGRKNA